MVAIIITYATYVVGFNFIDALYFTVSAISTAGIWPIPRNSHDSVYVVGTKLYII